MSDLLAGRAEVAKLKERLAAAEANVADLEAAERVYRRYGGFPEGAAMVPPTIRRKRERNARSEIAEGMEAFLIEHGPSTVNALADYVKEKGLSAARTVYSIRSNITRTAERHAFERAKHGREGVGDGYFLSRRSW